MMTPQGVRDVEPPTKIIKLSNQSIDQKLQELCERMEALMGLAQILHKEYDELCLSNSKND